MTRKEELEARARDYVSLFVMSGAESAATKYLARMLMEVEREVLERVDRYYSNQVHYDMDDYPDKFVKWLRAQQKELA